MMSEDLTPVLVKMHREVVSAMRESLAAGIPELPIDNRLLNKCISDNARTFILKETGADKIRVVAFSLRGRKPETVYAREILYHYSATPDVIPKITSYADIARKAGCTRAAVSYMAKQLPEGLHGRSGRLRS